MKKILLLLIFLSSFSFSDICPTYTEYNGVIYKLSSVVGTSQYMQSIVLHPNMYYVGTGGSGALFYVGPFSESDCQWVAPWRCSVTKCQYDVATDCQSPKIVKNGECVEPSDPLDCKKVDGQYSNLDGTCTDCSNFLSDSTVDGMANCACGAVGSSYNGQSFLGTTTFSENGYKYSQSEVKCADGNKGYVYYGKIPLDNNSSDNNSTSPDNNSTKPSDGNTTTPSDGNGTKDGNSTAPSDGNGTGSGKDYTKYLETIVDQLKNIGEDTDNLGGINNGINGQFPTTSSEHNIPTDTSGGNWNTYQDAWNNLIDSLNAVSTKVDEFQGLVQNGFSSPFTKSSPTTCPYTTSFVFGDVGSIPIDVDLCKLFSPLRSIFYYFFYAFFVFSLLVFHVKMFLRLV